MRKTAVSVDDGTVGLWGVADRVKRPAPRTPPTDRSKRGESNGCHRLHNYVALRLAASWVKHRASVRHAVTD